MGNIKLNYEKFEIGELATLNKGLRGECTVRVVYQTTGKMYCRISHDGLCAEWEVMTNRLAKI